MDKKIIVQFSCLLLLLSSCEQVAGRSNSPKADTKGTLLFNSGFEAGSQVVTKGTASDDDIIGIDNSKPKPNDWVNDIDKSTRLGNFNLQYQGGDISMRYARIIPEPGNEANKVLHFWLQDPNVDNGAKARIQANIYEHDARKIKGIKEFYQKIRIYLPKDMEVVRNYPNKIRWLTILEVWNNIQWVDDPYPFRITVGMGKPSAEKKGLYFMVDTEDFEYKTETSRARFVLLWHEMNQNFEIPVGKWITLEYYILEGGKSSGRFFMTATPDGEKTQVIFDVTNFTHNSKDPAPDGITLFNPMKLYTSKELTNFVKSQGKALQLYWDDFELWEGRKPKLMK